MDLSRIPESRRKSCSCGTSAWRRYRRRSFRMNRRMWGIFSIVVGVFFDNDFLQWCGSFFQIFRKTVLRLCHRLVLLDGSRPLHNDAIPPIIEIIEVRSSGFLYYSHIFLCVKIEFLVSFQVSFCVFHRWIMRKMEFFAWRRCTKSSRSTIPSPHRRLFSTIQRWVVKSVVFVWDKWDYHSFTPRSTLKSPLIG